MMRFKEILSELLNNQEILGFVYVRGEKGETISQISTDLEGDIIGGLGISLVGLLSQISNSLAMGDLEEMIVEMKRGRMIINKFNGDILIVLSTKAGNLGTITHCINKTLKKLKEYI